MKTILSEKIKKVLFALKEDRGQSISKLCKQFNVTRLSKKAIDELVDFNANDFPIDVIEKIYELSRYESHHKNNDATIDKKEQKQNISAQTKTIIDLKKCIYKLEEHSKLDDRYKWVDTEEFVFYSKKYLIECNKNIINKYIETIQTYINNI